MDPTLQHFRGESRTTPKLHPQEQLLCVVVGLHLCFLPWAIGTVHPWSQAVSFVLALLGFGIALINRDYEGLSSREPGFRLVMWPKLLRFPLFWIGLLLLAYITTQALNPRFIYQTNGQAWWLQPVEYIKWLPAGMEAPFADMNTWRLLMIYTSGWLLMCTLWVGVTRRSAAYYLLATVAANGGILCFIGILQRVTGTPSILWFYPNWVTTFFSTFIYKNHAGAYFNLVLMMTTGLLYWQVSRKERQTLRTNPAPVFAFAVVLCIIGVLLSYSRAGTILLGVFLVIALLVFGYNYFSTPKDNRNTWVTGLVVLTFIGFMAMGNYFLKFDQQIDRVRELIKDPSVQGSVSERQLVATATLDMAGENLITGWGAGCYRHYFPFVQSRYPAIYKPFGQLIRWEYAHNDYLQLLAELGIIGCSIIAAGVLWLLYFYVQTQVYKRLHLLLILLGLAVTMLHAWVDFQLYNPAILLLLLATAVLIGRWAELERPRPLGR